MNTDNLGSGEERIIKAKLKYEYNLLHIAEELHDNERITKHLRNIEIYEKLIESNI